MDETELSSEKSNLLALITAFFLDSHDFNGIPIDHLLDNRPNSWERLGVLLSALVQEQKVTLVFDINPHVKRFPDLSIEKQLELLKRDGCSGNAYPSPSILKQVVDRALYVGRPFSEKLALGEPHLESQFFELPVLERYYADPRYNIHFDGYAGRIGFSSDAALQILKKDQVLLETFGLGFASNGARVVVVFLRYLHNLTPEHQQYWLTHLERSSCKIVKEYFDACILGKWPESTSIYSAFLEEQAVLNDMATLMGRPPLFRKVYRDGERPRGFGVLLMPTAKRFGDFVHLLDKLMSDNINKSFFAEDVAATEEIHLENGKVGVRQRGTIAMLDDWMRKKCRMENPDDYTQVFGVFRKIRKLRQPEAHSVQDDQYDLKFDQEQNRLIEEAYQALRLLRGLFACHPKVRNYKIPDWLENSPIKHF